MTLKERGSGQRKVVPRACTTLLAGSELRGPNRSDQAPVAADRTPLESHPAETECLDRCARHPEGREQMALAATHDQIAADREAARPQRKRLCKKARQQQQPAPPRATTLHGPRVRRPVS